MKSWSNTQNTKLQWRRLWFRMDPTSSSPEPLSQSLNPRNNEVVRRDFVHKGPSPGFQSFGPGFCFCKIQPCVPKALLKTIISRHSFVLGDATLICATASLGGVGVKTLIRVKLAHAWTCIIPWDCSELCAWCLKEKLGFLDAAIAANASSASSPRMVPTVAARVSLHPM